MDRLSQQEEKRYVELQHMALDCARSGEWEILKSMLAHGLPANLQDSKGNTLIMLASYHNHPETLSMLLSFGADATLTNCHGHSPLEGAAFKGHKDICTILLESGVPHRRAAFFATLFGRFGVAKLFLTMGK